MEEINLKELFDYFKEKLTLFLTIVFSIIVIGCFYSIFLKTPLYQSNSTILLASDKITSNDVTLNKSLLGTYKEIATSRTVIEKVINNLSLNESVNSLKNGITVNALSDSLMIQISVSYKDKELAADITNELVNFLQKCKFILKSQEIKSKTSMQNIQVQDTAVVSTKPYNVNIIKDMLILIAGGVVVALAIIFIMYYFDTSIKSADDIEEKLGLPIFGVVPKVKRKEK